MRLQRYALGQHNVRTSTDTPSSCELPCTPRSSVANIYLGDFQVCDGVADWVSSQPPSLPRFRWYVVFRSSLPSCTLTSGPSAFSAMRMFALTGKNWILTLIVLVLSIVPVPINLVNALCSICARPFSYGRPIPSEDRVSLRHRRG